MKNLLFIFSLAITSISHATAQPITFQKTIGGPGNEEAYSVRQTTDGGYILAGYTASFGPGNFENAYLVKTDSLGDVSWAKTFGVAGGASKFRSALQTPDGGYVAAGYVYESATNGYDVLIVKADAGGNELWSRRFGGTGVDSAISIELDGNNGFLLSGSTSSWGMGGDDILVFRITSTGAFDWMVTYGTQDSNLSNALNWGLHASTSDGGYLILHSGQLLQASGLMKLSANRTVEWNQIYYPQINSGNPSSFSVRELNNGGYLLCTRGGSAGGNDVAVAKLDLNGSIIWNKNYGNTGDDMAVSIFENMGGDLVIAGTSFSSGLGDADFYLFSIDSVGGQKWSLGFGGADNDVCYQMQGTLDGGYIMTGFTESFGNGKEIYLVKTDASGISGCNPRNVISIPGTGTLVAGNVNYGATSGGNSMFSLSLSMISVPGSDSTLCSSITHAEILAPSQAIKLYPNPASHILYLEHHGPGTLQLTDMLGRVVLNMELPNSSSTHAINIAEIPKGVYVYRITTKEGQATGKLMVGE